MARKALLLILAGALMGLPVAAQDMTLDEVLAKHYEALGGVDNLKTVNSAVFKGNMTMGQGMEAPFTMTFLRPMMARMEFTMQGMTGVQAYDGEVAWMVMPFLGKNDPEEMADDQAKSMKVQADLDGPLLDWQDKGHQLELVGMEETEGTEAYKIRVNLANGDVHDYFLDSEYFIVIKREMKTEIQGNEVQIETIFSDYKEVGGLMYPHSMETKPKGSPEQGQVITVETIELNGDVSSDLFAMPEVVTADE
jgi:hypothetical protein